jgi:hypothetical protein
MGDGKAIHALEGWVRNELCSYALALRKLAYTLPHGVGEHDLLQLSDQMNAAGRNLGRIPGSVSPEEPPDSQTLHHPTNPTINEIRHLIPDWPDTHGIPWQMCPSCHLVYDPTCFHPHGRCQHNEQQRRR